MKYRTRALLLTTCLAAVTLVSSCSDSNDDSAPVPNDDPALILDEAALAQLEGIYEQRGYGNLFVFADNRTTAYSLTENTCLEIASFPGLAGLSSEEVAQTRYALQGEQLSLAIAGEAFVTRLERLSELPARCDDTVARDAQGMFDYVWATFDEYYAFFELRDVDWPAENARLAPRIGDVTDDAALFDLLSDLVSPIDDGHVFLVSDDEVFSPAGTRGAELELRRGFEAQSEITNFGSYADAIGDRLFEVIATQMDVDSIRERGPLIWATTDAGSTGYLFIESMQGFALDADGDSLDDVSALEDLVAAREAMDLAMTDLANTSRLIIDVRLNGGGFDSISLDFASRFVSERQLVLSKTARSRDFESEPVDAWLEPLATNAYLNPVTLIIGADSASATEIFAISMSQLPQVTLIGETTEGILSDILVKPLPNGWAVGLSNEVYLDAEGTSFEGVGVSPDIEVPVFRVENIVSGVDPALELALSLQ